jgi:hypothetical protein
MDTYVEREWVWRLVLLILGLLGYAMELEIQEYS